MIKVPTVSVLIPVFNQERYIGRCIRSLLNQSYSSDDFEIIVINDGSTDHTLKALEAFLDNVVLIDQGENRGLPAALNTGLEKAKGRFVIRVDADDYVHSEYLNVMSLFLSMNDHLDAVACDYYLVDDHEHVIGQVNCVEKPIGCGIMFRMNQLIDVGLYDEEMKSHEERDLRIRFEKKYQIERVVLPLYRYRMHDSNMTGDTKNMNLYQKKLEEKHGTDM